MSFAGSLALNKQLEILRFQLRAGNFITNELELIFFITFQLLK